MPSVPRQHRLILEAITSLQDRQFSGWEVARLTAVPRSTVTRVMTNLLEMGLLVYGLPGYDGWRVTNPWPQDLEELADRYTWHVRSRKNRPPRLDNRGRTAV